MSIQPILTFPHPILKTICDPITTITDEILSLAEDLTDTMYGANGIGLSANQIGNTKRMIVVDTEWRKNGEEIGVKDPLIMINPEIISQSEIISSYREGCLSLPKAFEEVERPSSVRVSYYDLDFDEHVFEINGLLATCVQHEIDHLNGIVFVDHISKLKRDRLIKKVEKYLKTINDND